MNLSAKRIAQLGQWLPLAFVGVFGVVFIARTGFFVDDQLHFTLFDDAMISMQYARNLADGHGLVWVAGGPEVQGYTNPLWVLIMAAVHLLPIPTRLMSLPIMILGLACCLGIVEGVRRLAREITTPGWANVAAGGVALFYPLLFWSLRGMEVGFVTLLLTWAVLHAARLQTNPGATQPWLVGTLLATAVLTRLDLLIPAVVISAWCAWQIRDRRVATVLAVGAPPAVAFVFLELLQKAYYGSYLPNTYTLKLGQVPITDRLARGSLALGQTLVLELALPVALFAYALVRPPKALPKAGQSVLWLLGAIVVLQCAYSVYVGGDAWESDRLANRYLTTVVPLLVVGAVVGLVALVDRLEAKRTAWIIGAGIAALAVIDLADPFALERIQQTGSPRSAIAGRVLVLLVSAGLIVWGWGRLKPPTMAVVLCLVLAMMINSELYGVWLVQNAQESQADERNVALALKVKRVTESDALIGVVTAGAIPYFSERPAIDFLGKTDPMIANLKNHPGFAFHPGHSKWDIALSVKTWQPDVIAQLWYEDRTTVAADLRSLGYTPLGEFWIKPNTNLVDRAALSAN